MAAIECFAFGVCCWIFSVRNKTLLGKRDGEERELLSPNPKTTQAKPIFLCIFDTVQVTKVPK
jgi:hypothetical protein